MGRNPHVLPLFSLNSGKTRKANLCRLGGVVIDGDGEFPADVSLGAESLGGGKVCEREPGLNRGFELPVVDETRQLAQVRSAGLDEE